MSAHPHAHWIEANQRCLAAEFAKLRARLAGDDTAPARTQIEEARSALSLPSALDTLCEAFALSAFERDLLILCAAVEMDGVLAAQCASVSEGHGRPYATFSLALATLEDPHWSAVAPIRPLRLLRLIDLPEGQGLATTRLTIDERVLHYLAGVNYLDTRLRPLVRPQGRPSTLASSHALIVDAALESLTQQGATTTVIHLLGDDLPSQRDVAWTIAHRLEMHLHVVRAADLPRGLHELDALQWLWHREAGLLPSALLVECDDDAASAGLVARFTDTPGGLTFVCGRDVLSAASTALRFTVNKPTAAEQRSLWQEALGPAATHVDGALDAVATQFRLSTESIARAGRALQASLARTPSSAGALWQRGREQARGRLEGLAQRVEPVAGWNDLVLPEPQLATLRQIATHLRQRLKVYDEWGFASKGARGLGISVLFSGESGTGKTMAAEVLANELRLDLYRIDLAATVSKYIGETEKNLRRVFDAAEDSGAILLFDEADALFGRRSEVKDSHDRYANIEVSYLLQRMEAYRGLAILTTNLKASLDPAFERRLCFTLPFPFPDQAQRKQIWSGIFPDAMPRNGIDHDALARLNVAGGSIRNIALNAAFLAADSNTPVGMGHLRQAARLEAAKRARPFSDAETRGWT